eukprot:150832_1
MISIGNYYSLPLPTKPLQYFIRPQIKAIKLKTKIKTKTKIKPYPSPHTHTHTHTHTQKHPHVQTHIKKKIEISSSHMEPPNKRAKIMKKKLIKKVKEETDLKSSKDIFKLVGKIGKKSDTPLTPKKKIAAVIHTHTHTHTPVVEIAKEVNKHLKKKTAVVLPRKAME